MNYKVEAILILLNNDCILERYYPLIPFKNDIVKKLKDSNINTKEEAFKANSLLNEFFNDDYLTNLFKRFLNMYEVNKSKLKEIQKIDLNDEERESFKELYLLPGVKETRARLYYLSGLKSLSDVANKSVNEIISLTNNKISLMKLECKAPLEKEARTHISVAKVLTEYSA